MIAERACVAFEWDCHKHRGPGQAGADRSSLGQRRDSPVEPAVVAARPSPCSAVVSSWLIQSVATVEVIVIYASIDMPFCHCRSLEILPCHLSHIMFGERVCWCCRIQLVTTRKRGSQLMPPGERRCGNIDNGDSLHK